MGTSNFRVAQPRVLHVPSHDGEAEEGPPESWGHRFVRVLNEESGEARRRQQLAQGLTRLLPQLSFNRLRTAALRAVGFRIGRGSMIMGEVIFSGEGDWPAHFEVGSETYISGPIRINLGGSVRIGDRVNIGHDVLILTVDHQIGSPERRAGFSEHRDVVIGDGAWLGARVTVLPGVTIGEGSVIAAGAVVASDAPPHTLVGGVPGRVLKQLPRPDLERASPA